METKICNTTGLYCKSYQLRQKSDRHKDENILNNAIKLNKTINNNKQAGAELGQAQLKLGLGFTSTNLH